MAKSSPRPPPTTTTELNPLNNIIITADTNEGEKYASVITDQYVITHSKKRQPTRTACSFYLSDNIAQGWRRYCEISGEQTYLLTEGAFIEYMQRHPLNQLSLSVTPGLDAYAPDVKDRIRNKAARDKITATLSHIHSNQERGVNWDYDKKQLQKQTLQAANLRKPDAELLELLRQAEEML